MKALGLCIVAGLSVSACATGIISGTTTDSQVVTQYPVETAMLNIYTKERQQNLVSVVGNQTITAEIKVTPKGNMLFNNKQVQGSEINTITKSNNQITDQSVAINYFTLNPLVFHGYTDSSGEYSLATQTSTIPKMAQIGDSNQLITENVYSDSSKRNKIGSYSQDWSLTRDSNNTAWFCINSSENALLGAEPKGTTAECYKINARGDILTSRLTINLPTAEGTKAIVFTEQ